MQNKGLMGLKFEEVGTLGLDALPTYLHTYLPSHQPTYLPTILTKLGWMPYLPTYPPTHPPTYLTTILPTYLPTYQPTYLPASREQCAQKQIKSLRDPAAEASLFFFRRGRRMKTPSAPTECGHPVRTRRLLSACCWHQPFVFYGTELMSRAREHKTTMAGDTVGTCEMPTADARKVRAVPYKYYLCGED